MCNRRWYVIYDCGIILVIFCLIKGNDCFVVVLCLLFHPLCVEGFMLNSDLVICFSFLFKKLSE